MNIYSNYRALLLILTAALGSPSVVATERPSVSKNAAAIETLKVQLSDTLSELDTLKSRVESQQSVIDAISGDSNRLWENVSEHRSFNTEYQNNHGGTLVVAVRVGAGGCCEGQDTLTLQVRDPANSTWISVAHAKVSTRFNEWVDSVSAVVPNGYYYRLIRSEHRANMYSWAELRPI